MVVSYNMTEADYTKLFFILREKKMKKTDLIEKAGVTSNIVAKLAKGEYISMDSLKKICLCLECDVGDIVILNEKMVGK